LDDCGNRRSRLRADIGADIASLRASVAKYRALAEERKAHGHMMIAEKLTEFVTDLEARVAQLETLAKMNEQAQ
jgi:hypothetical protein